MELEILGCLTSDESRTLFALLAKISINAKDGKLGRCNRLGLGE